MFEDRGVGAGRFDSEDSFQEARHTEPRRRETRSVPRVHARHTRDTLRRSADEAIPAGNVPVRNTRGRVLDSRAETRRSTRVARNAGHLRFFSYSMRLRFLLLLALLPVPQALAQKQGASPRVEAIVWSGASVITSKPANDGRVKTGQRRGSGRV